MGGDSFQYRAFDGTAYSAPVTVSIDVTNEAPVGKDDFYWVDVNGSLSMSAANGVLTNDSDPDEDALSVELYTDVSDGYLYLNSDGSFVYYPDYDFEGEDGFVYRVFDGAGFALVTVAIAVNQVPTYTVNTWLDTDDANVGNILARDVFGDTSLRAVIQEANASATAAVVRFAPIMNGRTISIGSINPASVLPALNKDFTIIGPGYDNLTVERHNAANDFRIFTINAGKTVEISGLELTNGRAFGDGLAEHGGAIYNEGTLTLTNMLLTGNEAEHSGGAIMNSIDATLTVLDSAITYNAAGQGGGGIANSSGAFATIRDSEIFANQAENGGGIANSGGASLAIYNTDLYFNEAVIAGGGIWNIGDLEMDGGSLFNNIVSGNNGFGGGLYNHSGIAFIDNVLISSNEASGNNGKGGGVYVNSGTVALELCTIEENSAGLPTGGNGGYSFGRGLSMINCDIGQDQDFVNWISLDSSNGACI